MPKHRFSKSFKNNPVKYHISTYWLPKYHGNIQMAVVQIFKNHSFHNCGLFPCPYHFLTCFRLISLLSHFWLSTIYDKIYIQYNGKSHMHPMTLRNGCRHGNDSIAAGLTRGCHHGRPWCNQQRQSRRHDNPRSSVDKIHYNISIKPLKHECICHNIKFYIL